MLVTIRTATPSDLPFVLQMQRFESNRLGFIPRMAVASYIEASWCHVAIVDGYPVGYVLGRPRMRYAPWCRPVTQLCVLDAMRHNGLGRALVTAVMDEARRAGQVALQAWTREDLPAGWFFARLGWEPIVAREPSTARGHPLLLRRLSLVEPRHADFMLAPPYAGYKASKLVPTAVDAQARMW